MSQSKLSQAADAVKAEYRRSSATVELKCRGVEPVGDTGQIFRLDVGAFADFDWTWEGARAFKGTPWGLDEADAAQAPQGQWSGDVVEVDKDAGLLFVHRDSAEPPRTGSFLVKPYGFLEALNAVYNGSARDHLAELLEERLPLALGEPPGVPLEGSDPGLESLAGVWRMPWAILWGPPGTGKTWTIGQQVAEYLAGGGGRVLVVSTTNKATDGVALAIGRALKQRGQPIEGVLRVGSGSNIRPFEREGLEQMLKSSAAELRRLLAELIKRYEATGRAEERAELFQEIQAVRKELREAAPFLDEKTRAIVCTAHHAAQQLATAEIAQAAGEDEAPFDTVIVDEAGLVSRAAAAALSCLGKRRFLLVGDPCQLAPISQMSRILPLQRGRWLAGSGLSHVGGDVMPPGNVHLLVEQRRMCPEIRELVSRYQYGGMLRDADEMAQGSFRREAPLDQTSPATWYVLDEENVPLAHVRADRGPGNRSWERRVTPRVLEKVISAHPGLQQGRVLYLSPFAAQVRRIREFLANAGATRPSLPANRGADLALRACPHAARGRPWRSSPVALRAPSESRQGRNELRTRTAAPLSVTSTRCSEFRGFSRPFTMVGCPDDTTPGTHLFSANGGVSWE